MQKVENFIEQLNKKSRLCDIAAVLGNKEVQANGKKAVLCKGYSYDDIKAIAGVCNLRVMTIRCNKYQQYIWEIVSPATEALDTADILCSSYPERECVEATGTPEEYLYNTLEEIYDVVQYHGEDDPETTASLVDTIAYLAFEIYHKLKEAKTNEAVITLCGEYACTVERETTYLENDIIDYIYAIALMRK